MDHQKMSRAVAEIALCLVATSCGSSASSPDAGAPDARPAASEPDAGQPDAARAASCPADDTCIAVSAQAPVQIALYLQLGSLQGKDSMRGVYIAANDRKTVLGHEVKLVGPVTASIGPDSTPAAVGIAHYADPASTTEAGAALATTIITDHPDPTSPGKSELVAIIGTTNSTSAQGASAVFSAAGLLHVSPNNTASSLTESRTAYYARTNPNARIVGEIAAADARGRLGLTKAATVHDNRASGEEQARAFRSRFLDANRDGTADQGITILDPPGGFVIPTTAATVFDVPPPNSYRDTLSAIVNASGGPPDIIFLGLNFPAHGAEFLKELKDTPALANARVAGATTLQVSSLWAGSTSPAFSGAGLAANGFLAGRLDASTLPLNPDFAPFIARYEALFGLPAPSVASNVTGYDAYRLVLDAVEKAALRVPSAPGSPDALLIPRKALRDALMATKAVRGLSGVLTCDGSVAALPLVGDCNPEAKHVIQQVQCSGDVSTCRFADVPQ